MRLPDASGCLLWRRIHREPLPTKVAVVTSQANPMFSPDRVFTEPLDFSVLIRWLRDLS
jgi:hypothetical protein